MNRFESLQESFDYEGWAGLCVRLQDFGVDTLDIVRMLADELGSEAASQIEYDGWEVVGYYIKNDETCNRVYDRLAGLLGGNPGGNPGSPSNPLLGGNLGSPLTPS